MEITKVKITRTNSPRQLADVTITLDKCLLIKNIKLIDNGTKMFAAFPRSNSKSTSPDVFPVTSAVRDYIETQIIEKYKEVSKA